MFSKLLPLLGLATFLPATTLATEVVYLVNCAGCPTNDGCEYYRSTMSYYSDVSQSYGLQYPGAIAGFNWLVQWEGNLMTGTFPDSDTFTSSIFSYAAGLQQNELAGYGNNKYRELHVLDEQSDHVLKFCRPLRLLQG